MIKDRSASDAALLLQRTRIEVERNHEDLQGLRDSNGWLKIQLAALARRALTVAKKFGASVQNIAERLKQLGVEMADLLEAAELNMQEKAVGDLRTYYSGVLDSATEHLVRSNSHLTASMLPKLQS